MDDVMASEAMGGPRGPVAHLGSLDVRLVVREELRARAGHGLWGRPGLAVGCGGAQGWPRGMGAPRAGRRLWGRPGLAAGGMGEPRAGRWGWGCPGLAAGVGGRPGFAGVPHAALFLCPLWVSLLVPPGACGVAAQLSLYSRPLSPHPLQFSLLPTTLCSGPGPSPPFPQTVPPPPAAVGPHCCLH